MSKYAMICLSLLLAGTIMSGCSNTFHGAGRDMENMGEWFQDNF